jgi:fucose 4-O-acetylase-like acetyltransferase
MERQRYWDILKGLGIIAVVVGHSGSPLVPFVYMYHIALFFFISGHFYNDVYSSDPSLLVAKRVKSLYWPFVSYGLVVLALHNLLLSVNMLSSVAEPGIISTRAYGIIDTLRMGEEIVTLRNTEQLLGAMWFLPSLLVTNVLFCIIRYASLRLSIKYSMLTTVILSITLFSIGMILANRHIKLSLHSDVSLVAMPVFLAGYALKSSKNQFSGHWMVASLSALCLVFLSKKYGFIEAVNQKYLNPWVFMIASCAGIYLNLYIGKIIEHTPVLEKIMSLIGQRSLSILALHFFSFKLVSVLYIVGHNAPYYWLARFPIISDSGGWWIAYTLAGVVIPIILSRLWDAAISLYKYSNPETIAAEQGRKNGIYEV